jgi:hypothetical protein
VLRRDAVLRRVAVLRVARPELLLRLLPRLPVDPFGGSTGGSSSPICRSSSTCQSWLKATIATAIRIT